MTRTNCGQCMGANPAVARAETGALSHECNLTTGCARSSAAQCFAAICSAARSAAVCVRGAPPPNALCPAVLFVAPSRGAGDAAVYIRDALLISSVRRSCSPRRKGARGRRQSALLR